MKHILPDGRVLMASFADLWEFFEKNKISGKTLSDVIPMRLDYIISNLEEFEDISSLDFQTAIETDGQICLLFEDGSNFEVEFSGDGPILLGYNTADFSRYPQYDGSCYTLRTIFRHCIGLRVTDVVFEKTDCKMTFPCYCGVDMSADDDGIKELKIVFDDGTCLCAGGELDFFCVSCHAADGSYLTVPMAELLKELDREKFPFLSE